INAKTLDLNDTLAGADGHDTLKFTTGGTVAAAALAKVSGFEYLQLADAGNTVTLTDGVVGHDGALVIVGGFKYDTADFIVQSGKGSHTVDASGTTKDVDFVGGAGTDKFIGNATDNYFLFLKPGQLTAAGQVDGRDGFDTVTVGAGTYSSDLFKGFKNVE